MEALERLDAGFAELPEFTNNNVDPSRVARTLGAAADRLQDN